MAKTKAQLNREIAAVLTSGPRHIAHVGFGTYSSSKLPQPKKPYVRKDPPPIGFPPVFAVKNRDGKILGTASTVSAAMKLAPKDKSYAVVRSDRTSDGTYHGVGHGKLEAVREFHASGGLRWYVG